MLMVFFVYLLKVYINMAVVHIYTSCRCLFNKQKLCFSSLNGMASNDLRAAIFRKNVLNLRDTLKEKQFQDENETKKQTISMYAIWHETDSNVEFFPPEKKTAINSFSRMCIWKWGGRCSDMTTMTRRVNVNRNMIHGQRSKHHIWPECEKEIEKKTTTQSVSLLQEAPHAISQFNWHTTNIVCFMKSNHRQITFSFVRRTKYLKWK